jgi:hypothetical protein
MDLQEPLAARALFATLCGELDRIARMRGVAKRTGVSALLSRWMSEDPARDVYPVMRLLLPHVRGRSLRGRLDVGLRGGAHTGGLPCTGSWTAHGRRTG